MSMRIIIAASDVSASPVLARKFRGKTAKEIYRCGKGKTAKEIYRCGKGIIMTGSVIKPVVFAISTIPEEFTKGVVY